MKKILGFVIFLALFITVVITSMYKTNLSYYWCSIFYDYWSGANTRKELESRIGFFYKCSAGDSITQSGHLLIKYDYVIFGKDVIEVYENSDGVIEKMFPSFE